MAITVIVRSESDDSRSLTFDGAQRVVLGRGSGSDVRLPDPSVSHRHASLRMQGGDMILVDEGSTNGTFVGAVRIAPRASRIVRSGDLVRVGRIWVELRVDQGPSTRDAGLVTRDLALAFVARVMDAAGIDRMTRLRVVEGPDQGLTLRLSESNRAYVVGRGAHCDLPLSDPDASREHVSVTRGGEGVVVRDLGAKNGTWLGDASMPSRSETLWRPAHMLKMAHNVIALEEPLSQALVQMESVPDEVLTLEEIPAVPNQAVAPREGTLSGIASEAEGPSGAIASPLMRDRKRASSRFRWSMVDLLVMAAALGVLALSLAALVWVLRG